MTEPDDDVLDVPGVMALLHMGRNAVYEACGRNEIPHRRIGKLLRFSRRAILAWLSASPTAANEARLVPCGRTPSALNGQTTCQ